MSSPDLRVNEAALTWTPAEVTVPDVPDVKASGDPMSVMVSHVMPTIASDVIAQVAATRAREQQFAANLEAARTRYQNTDAGAQQQIQAAGAATGVAGTTAGGGGGANPAAVAAGGEGSQLAQLMGLPMQVAQQAMQVPTQVAGAVGQLPQGVVQGAEGMVQQVGRLSGAGATDAEKPGESGSAPGGSAEQGHDSDKDDKGRAERPERDRDAAEEGATGGGAERAPTTVHSDRPSDGGAGRTQAVQSPEIAL
ncbi:hypothetical protein [Mycolicibacterium mageritense]|uniref:PE family protein n=1 Tax=Mycolicibacterium mageritense TaxID=53462 RepID=A0AAI8TT75_MYCME|nr:hypothetical protein [Mycolicibacterium mageritense]BDY28396.1 hypothetical protein hbim_02330 [Mycolicibacterium mageritense]